MKCVLHIGLHKTGSSSIQDSMCGYEDDLNFYANLSEKGTLGYRNHSIPLVGLFKEDYKNYKTFVDHQISSSEIKKLRAYWHENFNLAFKKSQKEKKSIFLSGEEISNLKTDEIQNMIDSISIYKKDIKIIGYIREPVSYARSSFQQRLKSGTSKLPEVFDQRIAQKCNKYINILGKENVIIKEFNRNKLFNNDIIDDFAHTFSLKNNTNRIFTNNISLSGKAAQILFYFNNYLHSHKDIKLTFLIRLRLINIISRIFQNEDKIPKKLFFNRSSFASCKWAKENYDINFQHHKIYKDDTSLEDWLTSGLDDALSKVLFFLKKNNISSKNKNILESLIEICSAEDFKLKNYIFNIA